MPNLCDCFRDGLRSIGGRPKNKNSGSDRREAPNPPVRKDRLVPLVHYREVGEGLGRGFGRRTAAQLKAGPNPS